MAIPGIPQNLSIQQGNGQVLLDWNNQSGATSYSVTRSLDGVSYIALSTTTSSVFVDTTVVIGTNYFYKVASVNADGTSAYTGAVSVVPTRTGDASLGSIRLQAQQRADKVNSNVVTKAEWNSYINQSAFELYDLLVSLYEDFYVGLPGTISVTSATDTYALPTLFYKLLGVDVSVDGVNFRSLKKFDFIDRNKYSGAFTGIGRPQDMKYRIMGNNIVLTPYPSGNQTLRVWYVPRMPTLLRDADVLDGVSGWTEYVVVDAAIKALLKEESDVQGLVFQKQALIKRIQDTAASRDVGQPDTISDTRDMNKFGMWE